MMEKTRLPHLLDATSEPMKRKHPRGQATVEYSVVSHAIIGFGSLALMPFVMDIFKHITTFYNGVYLVLQSGAV
jgi:hypothetical protein